MKKLIYLVIPVFLLFGCKSQDSTLSLESEIRHQQLEQALTQNNFVLEAERITFRRGRPAYVNPSTNFISLQDNKAIIQIAFTSKNGGPNGIGGITLDGNASNIKMKTDKKGDILYNMSVIGNRLSAQVQFKVIKGTNKCIATITPDLSGNMTTFIGYLYKKEDSNVFKGTSL